MTHELLQLKDFCVLDTAETLLPRHFVIEWTFVVVISKGQIKGREVALLVT